MEENENRQERTRKILRDGGRREPEGKDEERSGGMEEGENQKERTREYLEGWRKVRTGKKGQGKIWRNGGR